MTRWIALVMALLLIAAVAASAQSLAEVANKEKQRRKTVDASQVRSYDESQLRSQVMPSATVPPEEAPEAAAASEPEAPSEQGTEEKEQDPERTEAYWRGRLSSIDERIRNLETQLNQPGFAADPSNQIRRSQLERDLERARSERQAITDEARRKGVPPGWLRQS